MTITLRQKDLENDNKSLYLDIYENGKRKFEFLSLYLIPEINQETKERNEATSIPSRTHEGVSESQTQTAHHSDEVR